MATELRVRKWELFETGVMAIPLKVLYHHIPGTDGNYDSLRITTLRSEFESSDFPFTKQDSSPVACIRFWTSFLRPTRRGGASRWGVKKGDMRVVFARHNAEDFMQGVCNVLL
jgi:hypothetical protein